jgi:hypothetical protein
MAWLSHVADNVGQWLVFGTGIYATVSWVQNLSLRDRATFAMMFRCQGFLFTIFGFCSINFAAYGLAVWIPSFFVRVPAQALRIALVGSVFTLLIPLTLLLFALKHIERDELSRISRARLVGETV